MKHIVLFSGGLGSYFAAKRLLETVSKEDIILLFTDTKSEDADLYRFLDDAEKVLGIPVTRVADGRTIWEVYKERRFLGNSRIDNCSFFLKRRMSRNFIKQFEPDECLIHLGFDWSEIHRFDRAKERWLPYVVDAPLCHPPYIDKEEMKKLIADDGIELPFLYRMGFQHNNCGGFCVKAGVGHFAHLLDVLPERYKEFEAKEEEMRVFLEKDVSILRRTRNGVKVNLTLRQLREERQSLSESEMCDIGGCGCFSK